MGKYTPCVSIIVPIYNVEQYVAACLESLINQTFPDIEIICVDDRGTDASMKVVREYAARDKRIRIIHNWRNRGLSYSRNRGIKHARAPYVMFCDSDDMFAPNACEKMLNAIVQNKSDVAVCGVEVIYEANHELKESDSSYFVININATYDVPRGKRELCWGATWAKIYRTDIIRRYHVWFPVGLKHEDEFFWHAYTLWINRITYLTDKLYIYRRRAGSIMNIVSQGRTLDLDTLKIANYFFRYCNRHGLFYEIRDWFWGQMFNAMYLSAVRNSGPQNAPICMEYAKKFIDKHYDTHGISLATQETIAGIQNNIKTGGNTNT